jgi:putative membrane protein
MLFLLQKITYYNMKFLTKFLILTVSLIVFVFFFQENSQYIQVNASLTSIESLKPFFIFMITLILLNTFLKPILKLISMPLSCITLGLFSFVINLVIALLADGMVDAFKFQSISVAFIFSLAFMFLNALIDYFSKD